MDFATAATLLLTAASFLAVGLMAYFALRPERGGPKCPRCDKSVAAGAVTCPQCGFRLRGEGAS